MFVSEALLFNYSVHMLRCRRVGSPTVKSFCIVRFSVIPFIYIPSGYFSDYLSLEKWRLYSFDDKGSALFGNRAKP